MTVFVVSRRGLTRVRAAGEYGRSGQQLRRGFRQVEGRAQELTEGACSSTLGAERGDATKSANGRTGEVVEGACGLGIHDEEQEG
ncbi:hypothetical protein Micbo1qcDRAFT_6316 [Microdochium bolleyi]|uniref:Uncharacterized protein n=1 Tax=Microdochium bolleyi TaxID=196109 RepID=A0A136JJ90_9PEZI|nr:hypothetical protein Micbo1qcDRAFT_6316 [Microdochium bolleyi]